MKSRDVRRERRCADYRDVRHESGTDIEDAKERREIGIPGKQKQSRSDRKGAGRQRRLLSIYHSMAIYGAVKIAGTREEGGKKEVTKYENRKRMTSQARTGRDGQTGREGSGSTAVGPNGCHVDFWEAGRGEGEGEGRVTLEEKEVVQASAALTVVILSGCPGGGESGEYDLE
ncbi:hypothetical protein CBR_g45313 [Chara braunii]|uniref:Uncharacterized protein n=1 Tax=Chara braunii TaxID=69332 RepID=A0A388LY51_CHABU|nr:hypothetical protein CBR_g45313 [Chara braunii]|eukprot:GBG87254.1 hypothetical protein CBR_g45313 [Chara braunii]